MSEFTPGYAVLIGVGADLPVTIQDAKAVADLLNDPERCAFPVTQVQVLTESKATRTNTLAALDKLADAAGLDDTAIVYFSGHGYQITSPGQPESFHLMTHGYDLDDLPQTTISGDEFTAKLRKIQAQKLVVLLDCCHAGGIGEPKAANMIMAKSPLPIEAQEVLIQGSGRVILSSSRADELSYTAEPYSQFTLALLEALAGAGAAERDGYARVLDVAMHLGRMVPNRTKDKQHPIIKVANLENNFALAYYAAGAKEPLPLPQIGNIQPAALPISIDAELAEGYRNLIRQYRRNLLRIEIQMAKFIDQRMVPPDLLEARELVLQEIATKEKEYGIK